MRDKKSKHEMYSGSPKPSYNYIHSSKLSHSWSILLTLGCQTPQASFISQFTNSFQGATETHFLSLEMHRNSRVNLMTLLPLEN